MKIIPIYTPENKRFFSIYGSPVRMQRGLDVFHTHLLQPDIDIPILALGETKPLLETGLLERTDYIEPIEPRPRVAGLMLRIYRDEKEDEFYYQELEETDHMTSALQREPNQQGVLWLQTSLMFGIHDQEGESTSVIVELKAHLDMIGAKVSLETRCICQDPDFADMVEVVGYDFDAHRFNSDRKSTKRDPNKLAIND